MPKVTASHSARFILEKRKELRNYASQRHVSSSLSISTIACLVLSDFPAPIERRYLAYECMTFSIAGMEFDATGTSKIQLWDDVVWII